MVLLNLFDLSLPLDNPVLKFFIILLIILFVPLLSDKLKVPHILGLIVAGAVIGPNGANLLLRDSGMIMQGTVGLLYIMFLAGLEIDLAEFKKNSRRSFIFGFYTFAIPMIIGILVSLYVLNLSVPASILLASMFASHTLIAYPMLSKMGVAKNRAVNITIGGTIITDTLALLVLAVIVGTHSGDIGTAFWLRLSASVILFGCAVLFGFPIIGRFFLKRIHDNVHQYIFIFAMMFLGAILAEAAGIEPIIGAFLAGLALNRLVPQTSPLMNRIEFVGNAIFIPLFLIAVGMLIDYRAFLYNWDTVIVAAIMTAVATLSKFLAALITQKSFGFSTAERHIIFGLSNAQAAATLAAVLIGYNVIIDVDPAGNPIRLLSESILNGTIIMILITCSIATYYAQKGGLSISINDASSEKPLAKANERILIPVINPENIEELVGLSTLIKSKSDSGQLYALNVITSSTSDVEAEKKAHSLLEKAAVAASATDLYMHKLLRYDMTAVKGISGVIKEQGITDMVMGLNKKEYLTESFLGSVTEGILAKCNITTFIYKYVQPIGTIRRHIIVIPDHAEHEIGFPFWIIKLWNIARNSGAKLSFYGSQSAISLIQGIQASHQIDAEFVVLKDWNQLRAISAHIRRNDCLIVLMSRVGKMSYHKQMANVPGYLNEYFAENNFILIYPQQAGVSEADTIELMNPSMLESIEKIDEMGKTIARIFKRLY